MTLGKNVVKSKADRSKKASKKLSSSTVAPTVIKGRITPLVKKSIKTKSATPGRTPKSIGKRKTPQFAKYKKATVLQKEKTPKVLKNESKKVKKSNLSKGETPKTKTLKAKVKSKNETPKGKNGLSGKKITSKARTPAKGESKKNINGLVNSGKKKAKGSVRVVKTTTITKKITTTKTTTVTKTVTKSTTRKRKLTEQNKPLFSKKNRRFYAWEEDDFVIKTLEKRGWKYLGEPCHDGRVDYPNSMYEAREQKKIDEGPALFWADDDDSRVLQGLSGDHLISSVPNADKALTKVNQQKLFNEYEWFPTCFTLPKETEKLLNYVKESKDLYVIAKPRDSYGGFGMCVFKAGSEDFNGLLSRKTTFVVQKYMSNPYLIGGKYKFHIRAYMVISNVVPLKAHLWKNFQVEFATHPFDLTQIEKKFNKYSHITNYKVNNLKKNKEALCAEKEGVGAGSEWAMDQFFKHMLETDSKKFNVDQFWDKLTTISTIVAEKMATFPRIAKCFKNEAKSENHFEVYGLDVLMDEHCDLSITECNTQPGLDYTNPVMPDGKFNKFIVGANIVTEGIIMDALTLLGVDEHKKYYSSFIKLHG